MKTNLPSTRKGTMNWYSWGSGDKFAFMGSYFAYQPKFSKGNVNYNVGHKCKSDYAMRELIQSTWRDIVAKIPAEPKARRIDGSDAGGTNTNVRARTNLHQEGAALL